MAGRKRFIDAYEVIRNWRKTRLPDCVFNGRTEADFRKWRQAFQRRYKRMLGPWPQRVDPRPRVTETVDRGDHLRRRIIFDSSAGVTVPAFVLVPRGLGRREKRPGLLAAHGHGGGKADITGVTRERGEAADVELIDRLNTEYALEAVRRGYVVVAPDWMPFGERRPPREWSREGWRDPCNAVNLAFGYFGRPLLTQNIWDGMRAVDILAAHPNVDRRRLGVIGLSQGGTMTTHLLICDRRLRVGVVSGYISTVRGDALGTRGRVNSCGAQHVPGLLNHGDIPDMLGLAVPKPVLFETGRKETCFHYPDMDRAYRHLLRIYRAAGCPDRIARDVHPHDHRWSGKKAWPWLTRWLG